MKKVSWLLFGLMIFSAISFAQLTADGGSALVIIIPNACSVVLDTTHPEITTTAVSDNTDYFSVAYADAWDIPCDTWPYGTGIKKIRLWAKPDGGIWQQTGQEAYNWTGTFEFIPPDPNVDYSFAVQCQDNAGNRSHLATLEANQPRGWFLYPNQQTGKMKFIIDIPTDRDLKEFLVPSFRFYNGERITRIGVSGPSGWGKKSRDIYSFLGLPITNVFTSFDTAKNFRGAPFILTSSNRVAYFNLGPPSNPIWDIRFGANRRVIKNDGTGNSIIDFKLANYIPPAPKIVFDYWHIGDGYDQEANELYAVLDPETWDMTNLFLGITDQSQISQLTVVHYYDTAPWTAIENPIDFIGWPFYIDLEKCAPNARLTVAAIDWNGDYHYINTDAWQAFFGNNEIHANGGPWSFAKP